MKQKSCDLVYLGANACLKLNLFEEAITCCDRGLAVSFGSFTLVLTVPGVYRVVFRIKIKEGTTVIKFTLDAIT